jgi:hypothetical protein
MPIGETRLPAPRPVARAGAEATLIAPFSGRSGSLLLAQSLGQDDGAGPAVAPRRVAAAYETAARPARAPRSLIV